MPYIIPEQNCVGIDFGIQPFAFNAFAFTHADRQYYGFSRIRTHSFGCSCRRLRRVASALAYLACSCGQAASSSRLVCVQLRPRCIQFRSGCLQSNDPFHRILFSPTRFDERILIELFKAWNWRWPRWVPLGSAHGFPATPIFNSPNPKQIPKLKIPKLT